jgi:hypothetical protein
MAWAGAIPGAFKLSEKLVGIVRSPRHGRRNSVTQPRGKLRIDLTTFQIEGLFQTESAVEVLNDAVTLAGDRFQTFTVQDFYGTAQVLD